MAKKIPDLNQRFIEAMERLGFTGYSLSKALGTSEAVISNIRNGKNPPNILLVTDLLARHEELDPDWLLLGKGRMFRRSPSLAQGGDASSDLVSASLTSALEQRLERVENLLKRSVMEQKQYDVVVAENVVALEKQIAKLHKALEVLKKDRDRSA